MTQDEPTYTRDEWLRLLGLKPNTFNQRQHKGEIALAFGLSRPVHMNEYSGLDAVAEMTTSLLSVRLAEMSRSLSVRLGRKTAAKAVREHWGLLQGAVEDTEDDARVYTKAGIPDHEKVFFFVCAESDGSVIAEAGLLDKVLSKLSVTSTHSGQSFFMSIAGISISEVLGKLRANAEATGIALPTRFTVSPSDPAAYSRWRAEIEEFRRLADRRTAAKKQRAKGKQARARVPA